jgi:hypothetical protein
MSQNRLSIYRVITNAYGAPQLCTKELHDYPDSVYTTIRCDESGDRSDGIGRIRRIKVSCASLL